MDGVLQDRWVPAEIQMDKESGEVKAEQSGNLSKVIQS